MAAEKDRLTPNDFLYSVHDTLFSPRLQDVSPRSRLPPWQPGGRLMEGVFSFVQAHKSYFELAQAFSSVVNLFAWLLALLLLVIALRKNRIESLSVGPFSFRMMKEEAIVATATACRSGCSASRA